MESLTTAASRALSQNSTTESEISNLEYLKAAKRLFGSYRTGDANDPETYIAAIVRVLSGYPIDVVDHVVDPLTGIAGRCNWLPTPAEVKTACEEIEGPRRRQREWNERAEKQLKERAAIEAETKPRQTYDEFKAEMAARGLPIDGKPFTEAETVPVLKQRFGITDEQWNAIPDLPPMLSEYWAGRRLKRTA